MNRPQREIRSPTPEVRRQSPGLRETISIRFGRGTRSFAVISRVAIGTYNDGFIHAGNLAYLSMLAIFPFFITAAAIFTFVGEQSEQLATINTVLAAMPPLVAEAIGPVARNVVEARTGWLLWAGGAVGLWTVGSLIETVRDILRRAYGTAPVRAFWQYRLLSTGIIVAAVILLLLSLIAQVAIGAAQEIIGTFFPWLTDIITQLSVSRIVPTLGVFGSIYLLFLTLTPHAYRARRYPKWPGALLVTVWWLAVTVALPALLRSFFAYDLTYGSLAGIMVALLFFWLIGLSIVVGAELNAALAEPNGKDPLGAAGEAD